MTKKIKEKIQEEAKREKKLVALVPIVHNPGAGATTLGKYILWMLKEQFRCAYLDGDLVKSVDLKKMSKKNSSSPEDWREGKLVWPNLQAISSFY